MRPLDAKQFFPRQEQWGEDSADRIGFALGNSMVLNREAPIAGAPVSSYSMFHTLNQPLCEAHTRLLVRSAKHNKARHQSLTKTALRVTKTLRKRTQVVSVPCKTLVATAPSSVWQSRPQY